MQDPIAQELNELLELVSDVKTRLRQLEASHVQATTDAGTGTSQVDTGALGRTRNHLEMTMEALGRPSWGFASVPATSLEITGFYSADIYKALREIRNPHREQESGPERRKDKKGRRKADDGKVTPADAGNADADDKGAASAPGTPLGSDSGSTSQPSDPDVQPHEGAAATSEESTPSTWVKHRVDEIQKALSAAFGEDDSLFGEGTSPKPLASPEFVGNTDTLAVPELIGFFQLQQKTGVLTIDARHEQFTLEYLNGELIHARSSSSPNGERLGEILVRLGHVTEAKLHRLLAGKATAERIGDALRRGDVIEEGAIAEALQVQIQHIFHRLFDLGGCRFTFREGLEGEPNARVRYNVTRLLLETARHRDEQERDEERLAS